MNCKLVLCGPCACGISVSMQMNTERHRDAHLRTLQRLPKSSKSAHADKACSDPYAVQPCQSPVEAHYRMADLSYVCAIMIT